MLLKIMIDRNNEILKFTENEIILKLKYYSHFSTALWMCSVDGCTLEDYEKNDAIKGKDVFVGQRGGISI